eukprot:SAG11_NODE_1038_length_6076_cov_4.857454_2_plen_69_part_00
MHTRRERVRGSKHSTSRWNSPFLIRCRGRYTPLKQQWEAIYTPLVEQMELQVRPQRACLHTLFVTCGV